MNPGTELGTAVRDRVRETSSRGAWYQLGEMAVTWVREVVESYDATRVDRWHTAADERTCEVCGPLHGRLVTESFAFSPPIHDHCRCELVFDHWNYTVRRTEQWRRQVVYRTSWEWRV